MGLRAAAGVIARSRAAVARRDGLQLRRISTAAKTSDPLRILFCGSDDFSCASLEALHAEHLRNPRLVHSIDVFTRPDKPFGRGRKEAREGASSAWIPVARACR